MFYCSCPIIWPRNYGILGCQHTVNMSSVTFYSYFCSRFMQPLSEIYPLLDQPRNIVITFHQKPDADAMGSGLGLYNFLIQFGHTVTVISPTNWAGFLSWMPGCKKVLDYEIQ